MEEWIEDAACAEVDVQVFFERGDLEAFEYCAKCEVADECLQFAMDNNFKYGVFGGINVADRARYKKNPSTLPLLRSRARSRALGRKDKESDE